jgi:sulfotransferase family protein
MNEADPLAQLQAGPIFIVGHIRSGTTWVFDVLTEHPEVAGLFESLIFTGNGLAAPLRPMHWEPERSVEMFDRKMGLGQILERGEVIADLQRLASRWLAHALEPEHHFLVEKTPANAAAVETLATLFPDASVIHVLRDGRDVAVSAAAAQRTWQRKGDDTDRPPVSSRHMWPIGLNWATQVAGVRQQALTLPLPFYEVRYEDMHGKPHETARELFDFCAIPIDDEQLDQILERTHFSKLPRTGPEQFRRAGRVGDWRREWSRLELLLFTAAAGEVLEQTGYAGPMPKRAKQARKLLERWEKVKRFM